jgi:hypothetical protein
MADDMIFWDEMWNQSNSDKPKTETCCGQWDELGQCDCKNKSKLYSK